MNQSVVAVFEARAEAERAREELTASGVPAQRLTLHAGDSSSDTAVTTEPGTQIDTEIGIGHFFRSLFGLEDDRPARYEEAVRRGHATLVVDCQSEDEIDRIRAVLDRYDVVDIDERATQWNSEAQDRTMAGADRSTARMAGRTAGTDANATIPVVEEDLAVGKREVERGGVRVYTRVMERPVVRDKVHKTEVRVEEEAAPVAADADKPRRTDKPRRGR